MMASPIPPDAPPRAGIVANPQLLARWHGPRLETDAEAARTLASHPLTPWEAFAGTFAPLRRGKVLAGFARPLRIRGEVRSTGAHLLALYHQGVRVRRTAPDSPLRAWRSDGNGFWEERDLTKTGFSFLSWLETAVK